jgi:fumarate hydratase class II
MAYLEEMVGGNNPFMETPSIHPNKDEVPSQSSKDKIPTSGAFFLGI